MKHLLTGVAVVAALAFAAPVWAQPANPSGGNAVGVPGPNPGGPGLTPYTGGAPRAMPSAPPAAMAPGPAETSSAVPPGSRHARHKISAHGRMAHRGKATQMTGSTANQLNQEELARLQAGNMGMPPAPPPPGPGAMPPMPPMPPPAGTTTSGGTQPYHP
jgi:hypothetical protein